jgi:hypothetical protein
LAGQDTDAPGFEPSAALRTVNGALYVGAGAAVSLGLSTALGGEATWGVSSGVGAVLAAGVYELGRPRRLSPSAQLAVDDEWRQFVGFAEAQLTRKGRCHESEVAAAWRRHRRRPGVPRPETRDAVQERQLRAFVSAWAPGAERTPGGFYKALSLRTASSEAAVGKAPE